MLLKALTITPPIVTTLGEGNTSISNGGYN